MNLINKIKKLLGLRYVERWHYKSGALEWETHCKNDKLDGISKWYYESGALKWELNYKNDILISQKNYKDNGKLI